MSNEVTKPTKKKQEFEAFIKSIKAGQLGYWAEIAKAVGVSKQTIVQWKKLPEAQEAIKQGIDHAMAQMEQAGRRDWRMWESKLKMLGVNPATRIEGEHQIFNVTDEILKQFKIIDEDGRHKITPKISPQKSS